MNAMRKKTAVAKYGGMPVDEARAALPLDPKQYTLEEQAEILAALPGENKEPQSLQFPTLSITCEEWRVEYPQGSTKPEKLKLLRAGVKLQPHTIHELNRNSSNLNPFYYYPVN